MRLAELAGYLEDAGSPYLQVVRLEGPGSAAGWGVECGECNDYTGAPRGAVDVELFIAEHVACVRGLERYLDGLNEDWLVD